LVSDDFLVRLSAFKSAASEMFGPALHIADRRIGSNESINAGHLRVISELAIRDAFCRYHYYYDGRDMDGLIKLYSPECILVNPRGTYFGREAVEQSFKYVVAGQGNILHYATNVMVRLDADPSSALLTAYFVGVASAPGPAGSPRDLRASGGTYCNRYVKLGDEWLISEQRVTENFRTALTPLALGARGKFPSPSVEESSNDWIGLGALFGVLGQPTSGADAD
jgi:ketosteroid isomerase-like protein